MHRMGKVMRLLLIAFIATFSVATSGQEIPRASGGGQWGSTVAFTWEAHAQAGANPLGTVYQLDLLVLWRGSPGWAETPPAQGGANLPLTTGPTADRTRTHRVWVQGRELPLRVNGDVAEIQTHKISLKGFNVILIDNVGNPTVTIAGTLRIDPQLPSMVTMETFMQRHPTIRQFVPQLF
jgi:hypothetical protein